MARKGHFASNTQARPGSINWNQQLGKGSRRWPAADESHYGLIAEPPAAVTAPSPAAPARPFPGTLYSGASKERPQGAWH
jgi:hypothetical protein